MVRHMAAGSRAHGPSRRHLLRGAARAGAGLALAPLVLAGCTEPPRRPMFPTLGFSHKQPFLFRARRVDVRSEYSRPNRLPNVEHLMPLAPDRAAGQWAEDRLQANGNEGTVVRFTVHEASVVEKKLTVERGMSGLLKNEQAESYYAQLNGSVEVVDALTGIALGAATAEVWESRTLPESATLNEREEMWFSLVEALIGAFDRTMEARIAEHLGSHLVGGPGV